LWRPGRARNRVRTWVAEQQRSESIEIGRKVFEKECRALSALDEKNAGDSNGDLKRIAGEYGYGRTSIYWRRWLTARLCRAVIAKYLGPEKFEALDKQKCLACARACAAVRRLINRRRCHRSSGRGRLRSIARAVAIRCMARKSSATSRAGKAWRCIPRAARTSAVDDQSRTHRHGGMGCKAGKERLGSQILAITENRTGMIAGITGAISDMKTGIRDARASVAPDEKGRIEVTVESF